jgi:putative two-component system response regulator
VGLRGGKGGKPRALVVDDDEDVRELIVVTLTGGGYECSAAANAAEARQLLAGDSFDLAMVDVMMPGESGISLARHVHADHPGTATLIVTALASPEDAERALAVGVGGYLTKPFRRNDLLIAAATAIRRHGVERGLVRERDELAEVIAEQTRELRRAVVRVAVLRGELDQAEGETIKRLARAIAARSRETYEHLERVGRMSAAICARLGESRERCESVATAASLHDIGKVAIPDAILLKEGPLDIDEREQMQRHAEIGHMVLLGSGRLLELAATIALSHHERWDGRGYPQGLTGEEIPLPARICAVADVFDALASDRPYRSAFDPEAAMAIIEEERGEAFDPQIVDAFGALFEDALEIRRALPDATATAA